MESTTQSSEPQGLDEPLEVPVVENKQLGRVLAERYKRERSFVGKLADWWARMPLRRIINAGLLAVAASAYPSDLADPPRQSFPTESVDTKPQEKVAEHAPIVEEIKAGEGAIQLVKRLVSRANEQPDFATWLTDVYKDAENTGKGDMVKTREGRIEYLTQKLGLWEVGEQNGVRVDRSASLPAGGSFVINENGIRLVYGDGRPDDVFVSNTKEVAPTGFRGDFINK